MPPSANPAGCRCIENETIEQRFAILSYYCSAVRKLRCRIEFPLTEAVSNVWCALRYKTGFTMAEFRVQNWGKPIWAWNGTARQCFAKMEVLFISWTLPVCLILANTCCRRSSSDLELNSCAAAAALLDGFLPTPLDPCNMDLWPECCRLCMILIPQ